VKRRTPRPRNLEHNASRDCTAFEVLPRDQPSEQAPQLRSSFSRHGRTGDPSSMSRRQNRSRSRFSQRSAGQRLARVKLAVPEMIPRAITKVASSLMGVSRCSVGRPTGLPLLVLVEALGIEGAGGRRKADKKGQDDERGSDGLHGILHLLVSRTTSVSPASNDLMAGPQKPVRRLTRTR
jgi:hypothetical protein